MKRDHIEDIVALLRKAELDESVWPAASALIDECCGLRGNDLLLGHWRAEDGIDIQLRWLFLRGEPNPDLERDYAENYAATDERLAAGVREPFGKLTHTNWLLPDTVRRNSVTYNEYLVPNAGENCLNVRMPIRGDLQIAWSLVGEGGGHPGDWTSEHTDSIQQLMPHVRQFVRIRHALAEAHADGMRATSLLDTRRIGMLLLDSGGRIVEANERARSLLCSREGLTDRQRRLAALPPNDADGVVRLIGAACAGRCGGSMPIFRPARAPLVLFATPLGANAPPLFGKRCAARVLLSDPYALPEVNPGRVSAALSLTPAQGRVAAALAAGGTAASIAAATHRTEAAVRWHIRAAMGQLGVSRQADLVRIVLSTPGVFDTLE